MPIAVIPAGNDILVQPVKPLKALAPIVLTLTPMVREVILSLLGVFINASSPISVTLYVLSPIVIVGGITISPVLVVP